MKFFNRFYILKNLVQGKIVHEWFQFSFGTLQIRFEPAQFLKDLKEIGRLIDDRKEKEAKDRIEKAYSRWGSDHELARLDTLNSYLNEEDPIV